MSKLEVVMVAKGWRYGNDGDVVKAFNDEHGKTHYFNIYGFVRRKDDDPDNDEEDHICINGDHIDGLITALREAKRSVLDPVLFVEADDARGAERQRSSSAAGGGGHVVASDSEPPA